MKQYIIAFILLVGSSLCFGQQINQAEYFIGDDPGFGMATPIPVSSTGDDMTLEFLVDIQTLSKGFHFINIRACVDSGKWSQTIQRIFYVFNAQANVDKEITNLEYFIDADPGFGLATLVSVSSPGNNITIDFSATIKSLSEGFHFINLRAQDKLGKWSQPVQRIFYVFKPQSDADVKINGVEYFIDTDPGFGMGTPVVIPSPGNDLSLNFVVDVTTLNDGDHILYVRSKNTRNHWGQMYSQGFTSIYTSIDEMKVMPWFKLYPNPSNGNFCLEFSEEPNISIKISIKDVSGKTVLMDKYDRRVNFLNLNLPAGIYMLNIESKDKTFTQKIIIKS